jgi:hyperosmotically inducible periplasmic protein
MTSNIIHCRRGFLIAAAVLSLAGANLVRGSDQDDRIEKAFKNTYIYRTQLKNDDISISSTAGTVTLTGHVPTDRDLLLAADTAAALPGVGVVNNLLSVVSEPVEPSDDWVAFKVRGALLFHRNVTFSDKQVAVKDGAVTLTGSAENEAEKDLAGEYAADVKGVKSVVNELRVMPASRATPTIGDEIDDASITAQIKYALAVHRSTSVLRTEVSTQNGVVTIRGQAKNPAERDLVTKLAEDINGVKDVHNQMQISSYTQS